MGNWSKLPCCRNIDFRFVRMKEYLQFEINKRVQKQAKVWGIEGYFIFFLLFFLILCFVILIILNNTLGTIPSLIIAISLFFLVGGLSYYICKKWGLRGVIRVIASLRQPREIFCKSKTFHIHKNETS